MEITLEQFFLPVLHFSPFSIIPAFLHTHILPNIIRIRRTSGRSMGMFFLMSGELDRKVLSYLIQFIKPTLHALKKEYNRHAISYMFLYFLSAIIREFFYRLCPSNLVRNVRPLIMSLLDYYEGWNFNSGNYLFTTDTK